MEVGVGSSCKCPHGRGKKGKIMKNCHEFLEGSKIHNSMLEERNSQNTKQ